MSSGDHILKAITSLFREDPNIGYRTAYSKLKATLPAGVEVTQHMVRDCLRDLKEPREAQQEYWKPEAQCALCCDWFKS